MQKSRIVIGSQAEHFTSNNFLDGILLQATLEVVVLE